MEEEKYIDFMLFNDDWRKVISRLPKKELIEMLRTALIKDMYHRYNLMIKVQWPENIDDLLR